jgi:two-component system CheB/CheR fusion protein
MLVPPPDYIIAIGASAGGLEEINSFFDHTPLHGSSFIVVQHLSSDFKSRMVELLARHSKLKVNEAENGMEVKSNQVYLIPNDKFMTINNGRLQLTDKKNVKGPHLTINLFFASLAADIGKKAIGIILSGMGTDGTDGIRAIKKAGGMVLVRNPETTEYGNMPLNAIATGMVDFILEPELMPNTIEKYVQHQGELINYVENDEENIIAIINLIREQSPLDFSDYKHSTILRRTKRRAALINFNKLADYLEFLKLTPNEVEALAKEFLISVTTFFRDEEAFDFIKESVFPDIFAKLSADEELKVWVAGCATGEEVYSLAILVAEHVNDDLHSRTIKIFATDIDAVAIAHASKGVYNQDAVKNLSDDRIENYFLKEGDNYRIKPDIRKMVIFAHHDLVKNPPYCNMHFISCRNLLIYMTPILQKKIFALLLFGLKVNGYLFLGTSENPSSIMSSLEVVNKKWKIYKNNKEKRSIGFDAFSMPELHNVKQSVSLSSQEDTVKNISHTLADGILANLANEQDQLVVCVDDHNNVLKSYGDPTKYLLQKYFTSNLIDLLPKPLAVALNSLSKSSLKTNQKGSVSRVKIKNNEGVIQVNLSVTPLQIKKGDKRLLIVTIYEHKPTTASAVQEDLLFDEKIYLDQYTLNLEEELNELKDNLHLAYERLDATNENIQSFNEELLSANEEMQSTNEEMQSTNEEMQSVNEELHTINADYQLKNKELVEINDDLNNYFRSNINGQIFINNDLILMRFSPGTVKQINLLETDIGRPLSNISTNIKFETIIDDVKQVLDNGKILTKEIETINGEWYQMVVMPYVQSDLRNNGAVITFNNISELKKAEYELDKKNKSLLRINADLDHFVHAASHDLLAPLANIELSINEISRIKSHEQNELTDFLAIINLSIKNFREIITEIGTIAKLESDMIVMELVDVEDTINSIVWSLKNEINLTRAVINLNVEVKQILFSKKNFRSILFNLVSNAIKYKGDQPPVIDIHVSMKQENIILIVEDNGVGIPKIQLDKIFDMYGRLNHNIDGQGIGLYLAKKIVDAAGGDIVVESEPGKGSRFTIQLKT